ncbi:c-type cytochrome [Pseudoduganella sp. SL102]|uniref:c-type cytochrome n=1 Tax=Pseudoduganella sp. SL102 TaxID=2995154 RepID=UPI00248CA560|nr:c-type cytochrome [Pseudoduganella sp. SL102]WBS00332.1 c-type cytochrome [Pseudoduganella sp. SL102]
MRETNSRPITTVLPAIALAASLAGLLGGCGDDKPPVQRVPGGDVARGKQLLMQFQCCACHSIPGVEAARSTAGPPLDTFGRQSYLAGRLPNQPEPLVRWIVDPPGVKPGTLMPNLGVSPEDARHMAAYLYTLQ